MKKEVKLTRVRQEQYWKRSLGSLCVYLARPVQKTQDEAELSEHHGYCYRGDAFWPKPTLILPAAVISSNDNGEVREIMPRWR
ncbi:uncharacterized [Tachysurus ichikawai]